MFYLLGILTGCLQSFKNKTYNSKGAEFILKKTEKILRYLKYRTWYKELWKGKVMKDLLIDHM